jgi:uncharacterized glyoxalase superfamily protein PhnB
MYRAFALMLLVDDVNKAVAWYQDILGAKLQYSMPKTPPFEWASLLLGDIELMFSRKKSAQQWYKVQVSEEPANFIIYLYVTDASILYDKIKDKVRIIMEPTDQPYGVREFAFQDPFGFILIFAQNIT